MVFEFDLRLFRRAMGVFGFFRFELYSDLEWVFVGFVGLVFNIFFFGIVF